MPVSTPQIRRRQRACAGLAILAILGVGSPAPAQILRGGGLPVPDGLPGLPDTPRITNLPSRQRLPALPDETAVSAIAADAEPLTVRAVATLTSARRLAGDRLIRDHPREVEADDQGQPVARGQILALSLGADALARLRQAGFSVLSQETLPGLGLETAVIGPPRGVSAVEAIRRLRALDPDGRYAFNHLYQPAGAAGVLTFRDAGVRSTGQGRRIGLVDGSVAANASLSPAHLVQRAFAPGGARTTAHATAVASLIAADGRELRGSAPGATLYVADVYGSTPAGGSAQAVARAMGWLAQMDAPVINISLVGPPNLVLQAAIEALIARGHLVVAPVGNDGPAARRSIPQPIRGSSP
jgi:hypothetical protein